MSSCVAYYVQIWLFVCVCAYVCVYVCVRSLCLAVWLIMYRSGCVYVCVCMRVYVCV